METAKQKCRGKPWESGENEWEQGPWNSSSGRYRGGGAVEENRGIRYVGTELELEPGTQGRTAARGHTEEKKRNKIKMLGQHNILRFCKITRILLCLPPVELTITQH